MMNHPKRLASLQAGRGIAAIAVVLHHAAAYAADKRFWGETVYRRYFDFGALGVEFFFVLSGVVILMAHWNDQGKPGTYRNYITKRWQRIYPIYWIVLSVAILSFYLKPTLGIGYERDGMVVLSSILLVHIGSVETILLVAWTLFHEILFYILFGFVILSKGMGYLLLTLWFAASALVAFHPARNAFLMEYLSPLHLLFALGMLLCVLSKRGRPLKPGPSLALGSGLLVYAVCWTVHHGIPDTTCSLVAGLASFFILLDLIALERQGRLRVPAWMNVLGEASYSIYLVHFPMLSVTARMCFFLSQRTALPLFVWLIVQFAFATAAGILVHFVVEKPLLRVLAEPRIADAVPVSR
jgi:exopolysaccharide production protein ExoZ